MHYFLLGLCCLLGNAWAEGTVITMHKGKDKITIKVKANPTTGFAWSLKSLDKQKFKLVNKVYLKPQNTHLMGAGGETEFTFLLTDKSFYGKSNIVLRYARPWKQKEGSDKTFTIERRNKKN